MTKNALKLIASAMQEMGIEYGFAVYTVTPIVYPYFVGSYQESAQMNEDGLQESVFTLTGFSRNTWEELETVKDKVKKYFDTVSGKTVMADNGAAVAAFYNSSFVVPTGDAELKRIQINLDVKDWSVD